MFEYVQWYLAVADKGPYLRHAHQVLELVKGLPHRPGDRAHALAVHHARQIVSFYEHYSLPQRFTSQAMPQCQSGRSCWCWALLRWL
jgi:erythromycin esterase